jgi:hypothetical protein
VDEAQYQKGETAGFTKSKTQQAKCYIRRLWNNLLLNILPSQHTMLDFELLKDPGSQHSLGLLGKAHEAPLTGCQVPTSFQTGVASWWLFRNLWCNPTPMAPLSFALVGLSKVLHPWDSSLPGLQSFQSLLWNQGGGSNPHLTPLPMLCTVPWRKPQNIYTAKV